MSKKLSLGNDSLQPVQQPLEAIENLILNIRGKQVMLDRDLARLYGVETKVLNQAVKRNIERFPERFMFQLTDDEFFKLVTICDRFSTLKHSTSYPFAFTEHGVTMLASVLRSEIAVQMSIKIVDAFVAMRHTLLNNDQLFNRIESIEHHQLIMLERQDKTESQIETIFQALSKYELPKENVFYNNQLFEAHILMSQLIELAQKRIVVIDNYVDVSVLTLLTKRKQDVSAEIYTYKMSEQFSLDLEKHNGQYPTVEVYVSKKSHDRFMIIDDKVYHIGASIKDLGKKLCAVTLLNSITPEEILGKVK
ncbi:MAG: ORF6N domain-containing protein [Paludibacteraceae bacterium]|nr:ORF6N domain-containing protein [Paludibacteraceae bacterium]